jgi:hypothetical protein
VVPVNSGTSQAAGSSIDAALPDSVPQSYQLAAEAVRGFLVTVRGGAPFLSSRDSDRLMRWLDDGVEVPSILVAIERAAEARRRKRSRIPLSLAQASRHLGRVRPKANTSEAGPPPKGRLEPLVAEIRALAPTNPARSALLELADRLASIGAQGPRAQGDALVCITGFFAALWDGLSSGERSLLRENAMADLGDMVHLVDGEPLAALVEEVARGLLRERYPTLTAATVCALLEEA